MTTLQKKRRKGPLARMHVRVQETTYDWLASEALRQHLGLGEFIDRLVAAQQAAPAKGDQ